MFDDLVDATTGTPRRRHRHLDRTRRPRIRHHTRPPARLHHADRQSHGAHRRPHHAATQNHPAQDSAARM